MALTITSAPSDEPLTTDQGKRHLRVLHPDLDGEIETLITVARDYAERFTARTLRTTVTRVLKTDAWWCGDLCLPYPPLIGVTSVTYYDADNASQTLSSANYHVELSTDGGGKVIWAATATLPAVYTRPDAVIVTFTTGYAAATSIPPMALHAMKTKLTELFGVGSENELKAAKDSTDRLLGMIDWTGYA